MRSQWPTEITIGTCVCTNRSLAVSTVSKVNLHTMSANQEEVKKRGMFLNVWKQPRK